MTQVNLLTPEARPAGADAPSAQRPVGGYLVAGALALAVIAATLYAMAANGVDSRTRDLDEATRGAQAVTAEAALLQPYVTFATMADTRVESVRQLAGSRFPWERVFDDVARVLPADAHLTSMSVSTTAGVSAGGSGGGDVGAGLRSAINAPALVLSGCTESQGRVPELLSRLGDIRGATRVTLGSSTSSDEGAGGGSAEDAGACGSAKAPTFSVVVFFEKWQSTLPATAATGDAAATPTPSATATASPASGGS